MADGPLYQHALLCQLGLPRRHVGERVFERRSGSASLLLEAGRWYTGLKWEEQPLPYGTRPRIVMINVCAEAVRTRSRTVNIEHSLRGFLRRLGIDGGGYTMRGFKRQMIALSCCHMQLGFRTERGVGQVDSKPIARFEAWLTNEDSQRGLWPGELELSVPFYDSLIAHAVPLEPRALACLQNSAMALDVYAWLAHRLWRIESPQGIVLSWWGLREQFGHEFADVREFRRSFLDALKRALTVYSDARIEVVRGGLKLLPSPSPVKRQAVALPAVGVPAKPLKASEETTFEGRKANAGRETAHEERCEEALPLLPRTIEIVEMLCSGWTAAELWKRSPFASGKHPVDIDERFKSWARNYCVLEGSQQGKVSAVGSGQLSLRSETIDAARELAQGHDVDWLVGKFAEWNKRRGVAPSNPDAAFLAWVPSFLKGGRKWKQ